jgi:hypothetical protein
MPSTTALAISPERQFRRRLVTGLTAAGGEVTGADSFKAAYRHLSDARVVFYHALNLPDDNILKLANVLKGGRSLVLLVPRPGIGEMIAPLGLEQVTTVLAVGAADAATLAGVASRNFFGNIFGLERYVPYGVRVQSALIRTYHHKTVAMSTLANFVRHMSIRRKYLENIERVADELLMNALYDAPLVASQLGLGGEGVWGGARGGAEASAGAGDGTGVGPGGPQGADQLVLQYASDGEMFALGITDYFGALQKETLIEYVSRCLTSSRPLSAVESASGAGLGLYLVSNSVSQLIVNVSPGVATEVIALFNLKAPKIRLTHLSFMTEQADASRIPTLAAGRPHAVATGNGGRARARTPLSLRITLIAAVLVLIAAGGLLLYNRLAVGPAPGDLVVRTHPPGAEVTVDGTARGFAPAEGLVVPNLRAGRHTIVARKPGYRLPDPVVATVQPDRRSPVVIRLERLPAALKVLSNPPGATLYVDGTARGETPVTLRGLQPRRPLRLRLALAGYQPLQKQVRAPAPGVTDALVHQLELSPDWGQLWLEANVAVQQVSLDGRSLGVKLPLSGYRVPVGRHRVTLRSRYPYLHHQQRFEVKKPGDAVRLKLSFGRVRPLGEHTRVFWDGRYHKHDFLLPVGQYRLRLRHAETGKKRWQRVTVRPGRIVYLRL